RALATRPRVLLLDEPFSALDAFTRTELQDHLLDLWTESRPTLVLVTHDIEEALFLADRIAVMRPHPGRVAQTFDITLPRRRERTSSEFEAVKREILHSLNTTLTSHKIAS
ncbi:MAG: ABC transporter ATP-binding protein, partial [Phyllobacterium sp.]